MFNVAGFGTLDPNTQTDVYDSYGNVIGFTDASGNFFPTVSDNTGTGSGGGGGGGGFWSDLGNIFTNTASQAAQAAATAGITNLNRTINPATGQVVARPATTAGLSSSTLLIVGGGALLLYAMMKK